MKEIFIEKIDPNFKKPLVFYILVFSVFFFGGLIAYLFIPPERKIVEVPVEKIKYVDRVVEKKVEVPVEKVKYVDRVVEKRVEVPVEVVKNVQVPVEVIKYVEIPVEKVVYRDRPNDFTGSGNWRALQRGMSDYQVGSILGAPLRVEAETYWTSWYYGKYDYKGYVRFDTKGYLESWREP
jgi:hypothetical protein